MYYPTLEQAVVGYFSYDYVKYAEPSLILNAEDTEEFRNMDLMLFRQVIVFDNLSVTAWAEDREIMGENHAAEFYPSRGDHPIRAIRRNKR